MKMTRKLLVCAGIFGFSLSGFSQAIVGSPGQASIDSVVAGPGGYGVDFGPIGLGGSHDQIFASPPAGLFTNRTYNPVEDETSVTFNRPSHATVIGWGGDDSDVGPNIMMFTPVSSFVATRGTDFVIGYLTIFNGDDDSSNFVDSFRLRIDTGVTAPEFAGMSYVPFSITSTPDAFFDPWANADIYSFGDGFGQSIQVREGTWGSVEVLGRFNSPLAVTGFGDAVDLAVLPGGSFSVAPTAGTNLRVAPVPEGSTCGLGGLSILALAAMCRRRPAAGGRQA